MVIGMTNDGTFFGVPRGPLTPRPLALPKNQARPFIEFAVHAIRFHLGVGVQLVHGLRDRLKIGVLLLGLEPPVLFHLKPLVDFA